MHWFIKKECLMAMRYKMQTFNLWFNPFFMIAPYILLAESYDIASSVLGNMILWTWLCQFLFGISNSINDLRIEGTFENILMAPCSFISYQFMYYLYLLIDNSMMTVVTLLLSGLILRVFIVNLPEFIVTLLISSLSLFCFSVGYTSLVLRYKRMYGINSFLQQVFGVLSGYTVSIHKYPWFIRFFSYCIPLTYSILLYNRDISLLMTAVWTGISLTYFFIGRRFVNKGITAMKKRGDFEQW